MANPTVNQELCVGCGLCEQVCSDIFEMAADGNAQVKADANLEASCLQDAVDQCPVEAISA